MSDVLIKDDKAAELARLSATNFFRDKPADMPQSVYLYRIALKEAKQFGPNNYLAYHYARMAAYAQMMERKA